MISSMALRVAGRRGGGLHQRPLIRSRQMTRALSLLENNLDRGHADQGCAGETNQASRGNAVIGFFNTSNPTLAQRTGGNHIQPLSLNLSLELSGEDDDGG